MNENDMFNIVKKNLNLIHISIGAEDLLYQWKPPGSNKSYLLELKMIKESIGEVSENVFFNVDKITYKFAYIRKKNIVYTIVANDVLHFQLLEALMEKIIEKFNEMYDLEIILSYGNVTANAFKSFNNKIEEMLNDPKPLELGKVINARCRVCNKVLPVFIKKSMIEEADSYPVPIVYTHKGHAILCYIDKNFEVRGVELVNTTG